MSTYKIIINGLYFNKKNYALLLLSYYKKNKKQYIFNLHKRNCLFNINVSQQIANAWSSELSFFERPT